MKKLYINQNNNFVAGTRHRLSVEELEKRVSQSAGFVKMMTGVANNAALQIIADCMDRLADRRSSDSYADRPFHPHPRYKGRVKHLFGNALKERDHYRVELKWPTVGNLRFFNLADMPEEARKKYGVISDEQYFEFWESTGSYAYAQSQPLIGSLCNKFRLSLIKHGVAEPELVAWGMVGASVLELSVKIWETAMNSVYSACEGMLTKERLKDAFKPFLLARVSRAWNFALKELEPAVANYNADSAEERNVALGLEQLEELWVNPDTTFNSTIHAVEDYQDEVFSTVGHAKKSMRELAQMRDDAVVELEEVMKNKG